MANTLIEAYVGDHLPVFIEVTEESTDDGDAEFHWSLEVGQRRIEDGRESTLDDALGTATELASDFLDDLADWIPSAKKTIQEQAASIDEG